MFLYFLILEPSLRWRQYQIGGGIGGCANFLPAGNLTTLLLSKDAQTFNIQNQPLIMYMIKQTSSIFIIIYVEELAQVIFK